MGKTSQPLAHCRYFKGEESNPFEGKDQNKAALWFYEQSWVEDMHKGGESIFSAIEDYVYYVGSFNSSDGVPTSLKALLFNRFAKGFVSLNSAVESFKIFYNKYYQK